MSRNIKFPPPNTNQDDPGYGGEQISLDIESHMTDDFHDAKYAEIQTNESYTGGLVRQFGNLSFSRVYDAGHEG